MSSVNRVILIGNLGKDPEIRTTQNGGKICNLSVATSESWTDKASGERKERTEWHRVVIWNENLTQLAERYLRKGSKIYLEGQIETRKWTDQSGAEKFSTEIVLRPFRGEIQLLDKAEGHEASRHDQSGGPNPGRAVARTAPHGAASRPGPPAPPGGGFRPPPRLAAPVQPVHLDDDIPF